MSEVNQEALSQLVDMGISREDAIDSLKACKNDLNKAAEYFWSGELTNARNANTWSESAFTADRWGEEVKDPTPSIWAPIPVTPSKRFAIHGPDSFATDPKSRPPSRSQIGGEDKELALALQASLDDSQPAYGTQLPETSSTSYTAHSNLRPARQAYYDHDQWAMVPSAVDQAVEIVLDPAPTDRKRKPGEPAFLKPSPSSSNLAALITILHSIPAAREELLYREHTLEDYGRNEQWWSGQVIQLPKIISLEEEEDNDFNTPAQKADEQDVVIETQRIMAFLSATERAYGSAESLASLRDVYDFNQNQIVPRFCELWSNATLKGERNAVLHSLAVRHVQGKPENTKEFMCLEITVENSLTRDADGSIYDCLDAAIWTDDSDEDSEVFLKQVASVFTIQLSREETGTKGAGIDIPGEIYLDRYTEAFRKQVQTMKNQRNDIAAEITEIETKEHRLKYYRAEGDPKVYDALKLMDRTIEHFEKSGSNTVQHLREINRRILSKLEELSSRKQGAREALQKLKSLATTSEAEQPLNMRYRLSGVSTDASTTFIRQEDCWWAFRYSSQARFTGEEPTGNYETSIVSEEHVLRSAIYEGDGPTLLVYANDDAYNTADVELPAALHRFVEQDNLDFNNEIMNQGEMKTTTAAGKKRSWWDDEPPSSSREDSDDKGNGSFDSGLATPGNSRRNSMNSGETLMPILPPPPPPPPIPPPPSIPSSSQDTEMHSLKPPTPPEGQAEEEHVEYVPAVPPKPRRMDLEM